MFVTLYITGQLPTKIVTKNYFLKALVKVYLSDVPSFAFIYVVILLYFRKKNLEEANISEEESQLDKVNKVGTR